MRQRPTHPPLVIRLGAASSPCARAQAAHIAKLLAPHLLPGQRLEHVVLASSAHAALFSGYVDIVVSPAGASLPVPPAPPAPLIFAVTPARQDPRDLWLGRAGPPLDALPPDSLVGTRSGLQEAQLLALHHTARPMRLPDDLAAPLQDLAAARGAAAGLAGILLSFAELTASGPVTAAEPLPLDQWLPPPGQGGALVECRAANDLLRRQLAPIHDPRTALCLEFERALVQALRAGPATAVGVCAQPRGIVEGQYHPGWIVRALVARADGREIARSALMARADGAPALHALLPQLLDALRSRGSDDPRPSPFHQPHPRTVILCFTCRAVVAYNTGVTPIAPADLARFFGVAKSRAPA